MARIYVCFLVALTACGSAHAIATTPFPAYRIVPVTAPDPDLYFMDVAAINDSSSVVGYYQTLSEVPRKAFLWDAAGGFRDLIAADKDGPRLQVADPANGPGYQAFDINNAGTIVGSFDGRGNLDAQIWRSESLLEYPNAGQAPNPFYSAVAINSAGVVAGLTSIGGNSQATKYEDGVITILTSSTRSRVYAINDSGVIGGDMLLPISEDRSATLPVLWLPDGGVQTLSLGTEGLTWATVRSISNTGRVVGFGNRTLPSGLVQGVAVIWPEVDSDPVLITAEDVLAGAPKPPGGAGAVATFVGENGWVVGRADFINLNPFELLQKTFLWSPGGDLAVVDDLLTPNDSGWVISAVAGFNSQGIGAGTGFDPNGNLRAFLLVPVPEPASWVALVLSALAMMTKSKCWPRRRARRA